MIHKRWRLTLVLAVSVLASGCWTSTSLRITSRDEAYVLEPRFVTSVYRMVDVNTADIYLSDIPVEQVAQRLARSAAGEPGVAGVIIHIHLFLMPKAGRTPIEFTASNVSITQLVLSGTSTGVYGGGGFLLPSSSVGSRWLEGRIEGATLRLTRQRGDFIDRLGPSRFAGTVSARRDDEQAAAIGAQFLRAMNIE